MRILARIGNIVSSLVAFVHTKVARPVLRPALIAAATTLLTWLAVAPVAVAAPPVDTRTVGDLVEKYWQMHWSHLDSAEQAESVLRLYVRPQQPHGLGDMVISSLEHEALLAWHKSLPARRMGNRALGYCRQMWRALLPDQVNPFDRVKMHPERRRERAFEQSERDRFGASLGILRDQGRGSGLSESVADALWVLWCTGARTDEILKLRRNQVDLSARKALLSKHKSDGTVATREIHFDNAFEVIARRCEGKAPGDRLFPGKGSDGTMCVLSLGFHAVCKHAGIVWSPDLVVHLLRHDWATAATEGGAALNVVQAGLGHSDPSTTARYAKARGATVKKANEQVQQRIGQQPWADQRRAA